jgi:hypothetical protein
MAKLSIRDLDLKNRRVFIRVDPDRALDHGVAAIRRGRPNHPDYR